MRLSAKVKLEPTQPQRKVLLATLKTANRACNYVSEQAWKHKKFGRVPLHKLTYYSVE